MNDKAEANSRQETAEKEAPSPSTNQGSNKKRTWPFLLLLLVLAAAAGLLSYRQLHPGMPSLPPPSLPVETTPDKAPPAQPSRPNQAEHSTTVSDQQAEHKPGSPPVATATQHDTASPISPEAARAMMQTMDALRAQIAALQQQLGEMQQNMLRQQRMLLNLRLRWIAEPSSRFPDMAMAWQEIALLPMLDEEKRTVAEKMHTLAEQDSMALMQLRKNLAHLAEQLAVPVYEDVLPKPEHPWLAWIVGQFHLRKAPDTDLLERSRLREDILGIQRQLMAEQWPEQEHWQRIRARLVLLESSKHVAFPENFDVFRQHKNRMRLTAQQWMAGGS